MKIVTTDWFDKKYRRLNIDQQKRIDNALIKFEINPFDLSLFNHNLKGKLKGFKSIKAGFDLRIIFKEENGYTLVLLIDLGKHDEVY